jgi:hypothetical protein
MSHSVSEAAARAVKNSQRQAVETRTPEQRLSDIRKNRAAKLFVTPDDQDFLLAQYDALQASQGQALQTILMQSARIADLEAQVETMKAVHEEIKRIREIVDQDEA